MDSTSGHHIFRCKWRDCRSRMDRKFDPLERVLVTEVGPAGPYTGEVPRVLDPFRFLLIAVSGWMNQQQRQLIDYLREENQVLREQLGDRRLRFNDDQRRRLAVRAKGLGRKLLAQVASLVTPDTLMGWHRKLIAEKC